MVKKLVIIMALFVSQMYGAEQEKIFVMRVPCHVYASQYMRNDSGSALREKLAKCEHDTVMHKNRQCKIVDKAFRSEDFTGTSRWSTTFDVSLPESRSLFFIRRPKGAHTHHYTDSTNRDVTHTDYWMTTSFKLEQDYFLTPLSKGLVAAATAGAIVTAAHYAHKHNRLTRNISADTILQEQKDRALLPENQCSEIVT